MTSFVRVSNADNVVTATKAVTAGVSFEKINTLQSIPTGHKIATCDIQKGHQVTKYGQCIGYASVEIKAGEHVHTHNVEFRNTQIEYEFCTENDPGEFIVNDAVDSFMGFRRANGNVGTRNYIAIVTSVNCSATAARRIADAFGPSELSEYPNVDGVVAFVHGTGCGMAGDGEGFEALQRVMWGYARHPNHAGVLMVGLGCEMNQLDWLLDAYGLEQGPLFQTMNIQNVAGLGKTIEIGIKKVKEMLPVANQAYREKCPVSEIKLALQCGGSDAWSGITANPALGKACDILISQGGTGVLAETPEILMYLNERKQFGVEIGSFQGLQHRAAILWTEIELCKSIVLKALRALDESPDEAGLLASTAKAKTCQVAELASNEGIQMHGGIGMTDEFDIGFFIKRARVAQMLYGDRRYHLNRYAELRAY